VPLAISQSGKTDHRQNVLSIELLPIIRFNTQIV